MRKAPWRVALLAALAAIPGIAAAQPPVPGAAFGDVEVQEVKPRLYLVKGGGGNSVAFVTDLGIVLVDTKLAGQGPAIARQLKSVTDKPVTTIINTHAHADHVEGNGFFAGSVEIVAQENARLGMEKMAPFGGSKATALPKLTFKNRMTLGAGKDRIELYYFGAGHTNGDTWVFFPALGVVYGGDMFAERALPVIDAKNGGSGVMYPATLAKAAATLKSASVFVTGHDGLLAPKDLDDFTRLTRVFRDYVVTGLNRGLGITEVVDAWKPPADFPGYASPPERVRADVEVIFGELTR